MIIKEYRVILPISVDEYPIAHGYATACVTRQDVQLGDEIQIVQNEPFNNLPLPDGHHASGQFVHKIYYLRRQVPRWAKVLAPKELLVFHEKTWTAYPYSRTEFSNPDFLKDKLYLRLDSICLPDRGTSENVHQLTPEQLAQREIIYLDIVNEPVSRKDYKPDCDPQKFRSSRTGRGLLQGAWQQSVSPVMCCYKLMTMDFKWLGLQDKVEKYAYEAERKTFVQFYRQMFCWIDQWYGLTAAELRHLETEVYRECTANSRPSISGTRHPSTLSTTSSGGSDFVPEPRRGSL